MPMRVPLLAALLLLAASAPGRAAPELADPEAGLLELLTSPGTAAQLDLVDGLAFDPLGNLFAALEIPGPTGGLVRVDVETGRVERFVSGISRADQVAFEASGPFSTAGLWVTSEVTPAATSSRLFRIPLAYDEAGVPVHPVVVPRLIHAPLSNPEGVAVIDADGAYGPVGTVYVAEDLVGGRVLRRDPVTGDMSVLAAGLRRPEGLAFGDFAGAAEPALYAAETALHRVIRIGADGAVVTLGDPAAAGLTFPDNVEFGPDGFLYVSEDRPEPQSRILRVGVDGTHEIFATCFGQAAGLAFHPLTGDLHVAEQDRDRIWRVRFAREIALDVRPGSPRNRVRPGSRGVIPVAILGSEDLDVREIDEATLAFGPGGAPAAHEPEHLVDLDGDGLEDLLAHFRVTESGIAPGDGEVCLRGALLDSRPLRGCDAIETVAPARPRKRTRR
jgi:sugar lactone lactonase YvrE